MDRDSIVRLGAGRRGDGTPPSRDGRAPVARPSRSSRRRSRLGSRRSSHPVEVHHRSGDGEVAKHRALVRRAVGRPADRLWSPSAHTHLARGDGNALSRGGGLESNQRCRPTSDLTRNVARRSRPPVPPSAASLAQRGRVRRGCREAPLLFDASIPVLRSDLRHGGGSHRAPRSRRSRAG